MSQFPRFVPGPRGCIDNPPATDARGVSVWLPGSDATIPVGTRATFFVAPPEELLVCDVIIEADGPHEVLSQLIGVQGWCGSPTPAWPGMTVRVVIRVPAHAPKPVRVSLLLRCERPKAAMTTCTEVAPKEDER